MFLIKYWKEALLVVLLIVIAGFAVHIYENGKLAGIKDQQLSQMEDQKKQVLDALSQNQTFMASQNVVIAGLRSQVAVDQATIATSRAQAAAASKAIAALTPSQVAPDLTAKVGDLSNPEVLRKIDDIVTNQPKLVEQITALQDSFDKLSLTVTAVEAQRDSLQKTLDIVVPAYKTAYDAAQKKHSLFVKIITLGLVHDRHLNLPDPATLGAK